MPKPSRIEKRSNASTKKLESDYLGIRLRRDPVLRHQEARLRHRGIGIRGSMVVALVLVLVGVEGIEVTAAEIETTITATTVAKSVNLQVPQPTSRDSYTIRVTQRSRIHRLLIPNGEVHSFLRNDRMVNSSSSSTA